MPPNMRSILAQVHKKSLSMQSCRNFSSPASKEPKKRSDVASVVARTLGCATGLIVGTYVDRERFVYIPLNQLVIFIYTFLVLVACIKGYRLTLEGRL
ncbi:unnamed protein product [Brassica napus]|nr:unnamed protein product [Brassica napus]